MTAMSRPDPALDAEFRAGMRRLASGVTIIGGGTLDAPVGLAATSVTSLTLEPPTLVVCVSLSASAHTTIARSGVLSVNILGTEHAGMIAPFTDSARKDERFAAGQWRRLATGAPVLATALASFDCRVVEDIVYSTHSIFIAEVAAVALADTPSEPLVHFNRAFHTLAGK